MVIHDQVVFEHIKVFAAVAHPAAFRAVDSIGSAIGLAVYDRLIFERRNIPGKEQLNGKAEKQNYKVHPNDVISVLMPNPPRDTEILPEDIPLDIPYEDDDLLIVNKAAGMVVHPAYGNYTGTMVNALYHYLGKQQLPDGSPVRPLLVHRIDKNTSGLLVVAKNELAQMRLAKVFFNHDLERKYYAIAWGDFPEDSGTIVGNVGRNPRDRMVM